MVGRAQILAEAHQVILSRSRVLSLILKRNDRKIPQTIIEKDAEILLVDPNSGNFRRILRRLLLVTDMFC